MPATIIEFVDRLVPVRPGNTPVVVVELLLVELLESSGVVGSTPRKTKPQAAPAVLPAQILLAVYVIVTADTSPAVTW